jgi:hypothetical protein
MQFESHIVERSIDDKAVVLSDNWKPYPLPLEENDVIRLNFHYFYNLSTLFQPLKAIEVGQKLMDVYGDLYQAEQAINELLTDSDIPVRTCWDTGNELRTILRRVLAKLREKSETEDKSQPEEKTIDYWDQYSITNAVEKFEIVLSAELQVMDSYFVTQKGGYSTSHLIEHGESLIPDALRPAMPLQALNDFKQGCRCLAFELSTAVGFHLLRATESVLRLYYDTVAVQKNAQVNWTMGTYIHNLKNNGGDSNVIAVLEQVTRLHRNPLMHPEDVLNQTQALILTGIVTSAICAMGEGIQAKRAASVAATTPVLVSPVLPVAAGGGT